MMGEESAQIPDLVEPVVSWRAWEFTINEDLVALNGKNWEPGKNIARCGVSTSHEFTERVSRHLVPVASNKDKAHIGFGCGFYGFKTLEKLALENHLPTNVWGDLKSTRRVFGQIYQWGRVMEHEHGWRSQFAQVKALIYFEEYDQARIDLIKRIAEEYEAEALLLPLDRPVWGCKDFVPIDERLALKNIMAATHLQEVADANGMSAEEALDLFLAEPYHK